MAKRPQTIVIDDEPEDGVWSQIEREVGPVRTPKKANGKTKAPLGRYWTFTCYDLDWQPPVPYPENTPKGKVLIRYLIYQMEECPETKMVHFQGYVQFLKQLRLTGAQEALGLPKETHMEISKKPPQANILYCSKLESRAEPGKEPFQWGVPNITGQRGGRARGPDDRDGAYMEAMNAPDKDSCIKTIKEQAPRDYFLYRQQITSTAEHLFLPPKEDYTPNPDFVFDKVPIVVKEWVEKQLPKKKRARCLILVGPTRLGKTQWARSLVQPHMYWRGQFNLDIWDSSAKLLIADDWDWQNWSSAKAKLLFTQNGVATLTDKYVKKMEKVVDMPAIILANSLPDWYNDEQAYWDRNSTLVYLDKPLYDKARVKALKGLPTQGAQEMDPHYSMDILVETPPAPTPTKENTPPPPKRRQEIILSYESSSEEEPPNVKKGKK